MTIIGASSVISFVPTKDFARAKAFYADTLGLRLTATDDFALVFESGGTMIRVVNVGAFQPAPFTILGWQVKDATHAVSALAARGVVFERFPGMPQDALGIWAAPGGARVAWFKDPDGNLLSVSQHE
jgi:catechol 2,3-dioxygenase-like lactoylglutathione lyase family enzyme